MASEKIPKASDLASRLAVAATPDAELRADLARVTQERDVAQTKATVLDACVMKLRAQGWACPPVEGWQKPPVDVSFDTWLDGFGKTAHEFEEGYATALRERDEARATLMTAEAREAALRASLTELVVRREEACESHPNRRDGSDGRYARARAVLVSTEKRT